jgi:hypothetical protein
MKESKVPVGIRTHSGKGLVIFEKLDTLKKVF